MTDALPLITDPKHFDDVVDEIASADRYALDTEFHRERTYFAQVALVQLAWDSGLVLVDPLAVDLAPFAAVLEGPGLAVLHAADQDLEVLERACGTIPNRLFDTQIAAGFVGMSSPSLAALHERILGLRLAKGDRLTDWLRRPLDTEQLRYAASDVDHLLELTDHLIDDLEQRGRLQWALDECERFRVRPRGARDPQEAWRRIKEARQLRGKAAMLAQSIAAWREERAIATDQPVRFVLPDLAVVTLAQRPPRSIGDLRGTRGIDDRHLRQGAADSLLAAIADTIEHGTPPTAATPVAELDRDLRPAVNMVSAWISQRARDLDLDPTLLATRNDLESLLRGDEDARLLTGWRATMVGEPIRRLVSGDAALVFVNGGGLVLEERSHQPLLQD
jgi:ribonuclease D